MSRNLPHWLPVILLVLGVTSASTRGQDERDEDLRSQLRTEMLAELERQQLVGLQATILTAEGKTISISVGEANLEHHVPIESQTRLPIASITKAMTGVVYLKSLEQKLFDESDDVRKYVPEFPETDPPILMKHLVNQCHGIRHYRVEFYPEYFATQYDDLESTLELFKDDELVAKSGERYTYSSYAYSLLGLALERIHKKPYEQLLSEMVFEAAGLKNTLPNNIAAPIERRSDCYSFFQLGWPYEKAEALQKVISLNYSYNKAGGNLLSTTDDLVTFAKAVVDSRILSEESFEKIQQGQRLDSGELLSWNYGWFVTRGEDGVRMRINGANPGSWAHLRVFPEEGVIVAMATNTWGVGSRGEQRGLSGLLDSIETILELD